MIAAAARDVQADFDIVGLLGEGGDGADFIQLARCVGSQLQGFGANGVGDGGGRIDERREPGGHGGPIFQALQAAGVAGGREIADDQARR